MTEQEFEIWFEMQCYANGNEPNEYNDLMDCIG